MTVLTIGHSKGGVGKSPVAQNLAIMRAITGRSVCVLDADQQGTSWRFFAARAAGKQQPAVRCIRVNHETMADHIDALTAAGVEVFVDVRGTEDEALNTAITLSDGLIVPASIKAHALDATPDLNDLVGAIIAKGRSDLVVMAFLTDLDPLPTVRAPQLDEARATLAECQYLPLIAGVELNRANAWDTSFRENLSVVEFERARVAKMRPFQRRQFSAAASFDFGLLYAAVFGEVFNVAEYLGVGETVQ